MPGHFYFVVLEGSDKFSFDILPGAGVVSQGTACEFEISIPPLCSTKTDDARMFILKQKGLKETANIPIGIPADTEVTTKLHADTTCVKQIRERVW